MQTRFKKGTKIFDIVITAVAGMLSVVVMLYGVAYFGLKEAWPELVLNLFYVACLVMIGMYFFNYRITTHHFPPPLAFYALHVVCLVLAVLLLCTLTFFYARRNWKSYTKRNLWTICVIDILIATLYNYDIYIEPFSEYTNYMLTEIWIRPTITYGLVACFVTESEAAKHE